MFHWVSLFFSISATAFVFFSSLCFVFVFVFVFLLLFGFCFPFSLSLARANSHVCLLNFLAVSFLPFQPTFSLSSLSLPTFSLLISSADRRRVSHSRRFSTSLSEALCQFGLLIASSLRFGALFTSASLSLS